MNPNQSSIRNKPPQINVVNIRVYNPWNERGGSSIIESSRKGNDYGNKPQRASQPIVPHPYNISLGPPRKPINRTFPDRHPFVVSLIQSIENSGHTVFDEKAREILISHLTKQLYKWIFGIANVARARKNVGIPIPQQYTSFGWHNESNRTLEYSFIREYLNPDLYNEERFSNYRPYIVKKPTTYTNYQFDENSRENVQRKNLITKITQLAIERIQQLPDLPPGQTKTNSFSIQTTLNLPPSLKGIDDLMKKGVFEDKIKTREGSIYDLIFYFEQESLRNDIKGNIQTSLQDFVTTLKKNQNK